MPPHPTTNNKQQTTNSRRERLSPAWRLNLAMAYAAKGELDQAATAVEQAYAADPNLKDGYARVAWQSFWPEKKLR